MIFNESDNLEKELKLEYGKFKSFNIWNIDLPFELFRGNIH